MVKGKRLISFRRFLFMLALLPLILLVVFFSSVIIVLVLGLFILVFIVGYIYLMFGRKKGKVIVIR